MRGVGLLKSEDDLKNIVLTARAGTPVFVRDVADVRIGEAVRQGAALMNGEKEVVGGIVMMLRGANGRDVVESVESKGAGDQRQQHSPSRDQDRPLL